MLARSKIVNALVTEIKKIDGTGTYNINLHNNVQKGLKFWDEINDFPYVCITASDETRQYLPSDFKWAFLTVNIKIYVKDENPENILENALLDIETVLDANNNLSYDPDNPGAQLTDIRIISISTDEGLLTPIGVGDMYIQIRYDL